MNKHLIDTLIVIGNFKNDAELARRMRVSPSVICNQRKERAPVSPGHMIVINEQFDMPIAEIKFLVARERTA